MKLRNSSGGSSRGSNSLEQRRELRVERKKQIKGYTIVWHFIGVILSEFHAGQLSEDFLSRNGEHVITRRAAETLQERLARL